MTTSNSELIPLIYHHLKEQGFHTAADELQKQVTQNEAPSTSTTLLDIYAAWLKSSKRRKKPATSKPSAPDQKQTPPKKAAQRKKSDKTTKPGSKSGSANKKSTPAKRSKSDGRTTAKVVKSNKPGTLKEEAAGGGDSDSDSSLDVEKWKKRIHEMTDTDLAKVEAFNALATPEPKKTRVRKPRAKPKPTNETSINGPSPQGEKSDQSTKSNVTKKSRAKKVVPVAALDSSNKDQNNETAAASVISTSKQSPKKEKRKALDQASLEPKQKKKKQAVQNNVSTNATDGDNLIDKNMNNNKDANIVCLIEESEISTLNLQTEPKKAKKKQTNQNNVIGNVTNSDGLVEKNMNNEAKIISQIEVEEGNQENASNLQTEPAEADSVVKVKKKKKKKDKADDDVDVDSQQAVVDTTTDSVIKKRKKRNEETTDSNVLDKECITGEDLNVNLPAVDITSSLNAANAEADSVVKVKKKKKKPDKADHEVDSQQIVIDANTNPVIVGECEKTMEEASPNTEVSKKKKKKKDKNKEESETLQQTETNVFDKADCVENTEQIVVRKKSKKKKQNEEQLGSEDITPITEGCEVPEELPDPPSTPQTPGSKKKKHKLDSELIIADAVSPTLDSETHKKKKKKGSKSKETES